MAPCNGSTSAPPKLAVTLPSPNHSTLQWHPTMAPRPLHPAMAYWCHVSSPSPPTGSKNPYSYRYLGKKKQPEQSMSKTARMSVKDSPVNTTDLTNTKSITWLRQPTHTTHTERQHLPQSQPIHAQHTCGHTRLQTLSATKTRQSEQQTRSAGTRTQTNTKKKKPKKSLLQRTLQ